MLTECRECHHLVSNQAPACPQCGIKAPGLSRRQRIISWVVFLTLLPIGLIGMFVLFLLFVG